MPKLLNYSRRVAKLLLYCSLLILTQLLPALQAAQLPDPIRQSTVNFNVFALSSYHTTAESVTTLSVSLSAVSLSAASARVLINTPIKLTATPTGGVSVEYQFYRRLSSGWESLTGGRYLPSKICNYTPTVPGAQLFRVNAREAGTTRYFPGEVTVTVCVALSSVRLNATPSPVPVGTRINLSATPVGGASVEYQFYRRLSSGWESLTGGKYLPTMTCNFTPLVTGAQLFRVNAREVGTSNYYPGEITVTVCAILSRVTLSASPSPVSVGTRINLTATRSGGASVEYQFYRRLGSGWQSLTGGNYLPSRTCSYTPSVPGSQLFRVNAREVGTTRYYPGEVTVLVNKVNNPTDSAEWVWVPGGVFIMGSADGLGGADEHPTRSITQTGFWMYRYEVTVAQYRAFCQATSRSLPPFPNPVAEWGAPSNYSWQGKTGWEDPTLQQHPIVNVSWDDAKAYAAWAMVALPSETEWEYAVRGSVGNNFPWGGIGTVSDMYNGWDSAKCANDGNSKSQQISTWAVGSFPAGASWCGAQDLAGNVWEWCADNYGAYPATRATSQDVLSNRVIRGGSWFESNQFVFRSAARYYASPQSKWPLLGFRCVSLP